MGTSKNVNIAYNLFVKQNIVIGNFSNETVLPQILDKLRYYNKQGNPYELHCKTLSWRSEKI